MHPTRSLVESRDAELEWLRHEFKLDDRQFAEIKRLHGAYDPECDALCQRMIKAQTNFEELVGKNQSLTPELAQALREVAQVREACQTAMLQEIYREGQVMNPDQRQRYLKVMEPHVLRPESRNSETPLLP